MLPEDQKSAIRVAVATTSNVTIATALNAGDVLNGRTLVAGDLVLLAGQSTAAQNGLYVVGDNPVRHPDYDSYENGGRYGPQGAYDRFPGMTVIDEQNGDTYVCTSVRGGTLGTTALTFTNLFSTASSAELATMLSALLTTRGDIVRRGASAPERYGLGAAGTLLTSDGTDIIYRTLTAWFDAVFTGEADGNMLARLAGSWTNSTFTAYLDSIFTGEANGDLVGRTGGSWVNRTLAAVLGDMLTTRGDIVRRGSGGVERLAVGATSGQVLQSDGTDASWGDIVDGGTYTPSLTNAANLSASTAYTCAYLRIANVCFVAGKYDADAVAAASTTTTLGISLPVASNFTNESNAGGTAICHSPSQSCRVVADLTNDRLNVNWLSLSTSNLGFSFIAGYIIQ